MSPVGEPATGTRGRLHRVGIDGVVLVPWRDRPAATSMAVPSYSHPEHVTINKGVWMSPQPGVPILRQVVLDTIDVRALAEFYRRLLDLQYRPGDEHPGADAL